MWQDVLIHSHMPPSFFCSSCSTGGTLWTEPPGEGWPNLSWSRLQFCWSRHYCAAQVCANLCRVIISATPWVKALTVCIFPIFYSCSWILAPRTSDIHLCWPIHPLVKARSRGPEQEARVPSTTYCPAHLKALGKPALTLALGGLSGS